MQFDAPPKYLFYLSHSSLVSRYLQQHIHISYNNISTDHCRFEQRQDKEQETNMLLVEVGGNLARM